MHVVANLANKGNIVAELLQGNQYVGRRSARIALEQLLAGRRDACIREVDQYLAKCGNGNHYELLSLGTIPHR